MKSSLMFDKLLFSGMKKMVLDLRDNPGAIWVQHLCVMNFWRKENL